MLRPEVEGIDYGPLSNSDQAMLEMAATAHVDESLDLSAFYVDES